MKKFIMLSALLMLTFSVNAVTYMRVHKSNGQIEQYEVDSVTMVDFADVNTSAFDSTQGVHVSGNIGSYTYVDLGLPSGVKWATYNVGATLPSEFGNKYAWGETEVKSASDWTNYEWCEGRDSSMTKYCTDASYGKVDDVTTLNSSDDVATVEWGSNWRMPTATEAQELLDGCDWVNYTINGQAGRLGTSKYNGNTIFLTAVPDDETPTVVPNILGHGIGSLNFAHMPSSTFYWTSSLDETNSSNAKFLGITFCWSLTYGEYISSDARFILMYVRPVLDE